WGTHAHAFARPLHWLVMLLGDDVVEATLFGVRADRMSRGHRFMHDKTVWIARPDEYVEALRAAKVLVDPDARRACIVDGVNAAAERAGGTARIDPDNLAQVECLVEWPYAVLCSFEADFLEVPHEALVATMETNQKFFPVLDAAGALDRHFVGVANIAPADDGRIRQGYERVIRPRFSDARFFFVEDRKQGLASMQAGLAQVTYQARLGSVADKTARVATLAAAIAPRVGVDAALAQRAAAVSKADLQSRLVNEFPELQGIAGRHYAMLDAGLLDLGHDRRHALALAIDEAYQPRVAGDAIATSALGKVLAIAERLDTLAGGFAAGLKPTGNKDPFALRRTALGLARTLIEGGLELDLRDLLVDAVQGAAEAIALSALRAKVSAADEARSRGVAVDGGQSVARSTSLEQSEELYDFILDRLRGYYAERDVSAGQFNAVAALRPRSLYDFDRRLDALAAFAALPDAEALSAADKRIRNILRKAEGVVPDSVDATLLQEPAEQALADAVDALYADTDAALHAGDYSGVLARLALLRPQVDGFFDAVMVNVEDAALRSNRLALLARLASRMGSVAAIGQLSG
ncbi:MAG TPA: glycine--tRNA ligase subunit beta, partial [Luteimonas sp.]|nr:glycine--tRNA ligase subunit beta [Luteimonas sp.]